MYSSQFLRVWANETRGTAGAKGYCRDCTRPITWFTTVANHKAIPLDGHEPVPVRTEHDPETYRTIEIHERSTVHFATCPKRARGSARP